MSASSRPEWIEYKEVQLTQNLLGAGSYGQVYEGKYEDMPVAVKIIHEKVRGKNFEEEYRVWRERDLTHEHILPIHGCVNTKIADKSLKYIVMPLCKESLEKALQERNMNWDQRVQIMLQIAQGMNYLHSHGVLHMDLKSSNILLNYDNAVKICDFGFFQTAQGTGTPGFMAPEVMEGGLCTPESDVFSFAMVLYHILTSQRAFARILRPVQILFKLSTKKTRPKIPPTIPRTIAILTRWCWNNDPGKRPSFPEIVHLLETLVAAPEYTLREDQIQDVISGNKLIFWRDAEAEQDLCELQDLFNQLEINGDTIRGFIDEGIYVQQLRSISEEELEILVPEEQRRERLLEWIATSDSDKQKPKPGGLDQPEFGRAISVGDPSQVKESLPSLIYAAENGYSSQVRELLRSQPPPNVNATDEYGTTALMKASSSGYVEIVQILLEHSQPDINLQSKPNKQTALLFATLRGHYDVVRELLKHPSLNVTLESKDGATALSIAAEMGSLELTELFIEYSQQLGNPPITAQDVNCKAIRAACSHERYEICNAILLARFQFNIKDKCLTTIMSDLESAEEKSQCSSDSKSDSSHSKTTKGSSQELISNLLLAAISRGLQPIVKQLLSSKLENYIQRINKRKLHRITIQSRNLAIHDLLQKNKLLEHKVKWNSQCYKADKSASFALLHARSNLKGNITDIENKNLKSSDLRQLFISGSLSHFLKGRLLSEISLDFRRLHILDLSHNGLEQLPSLAPLQQLQELYLHNNRLPTLPYEIKQLKQLQVLTCHHNDLLDPDILRAFRQGGNDAVLSYLQELDDIHEDIYFCSLILCGDSGAGKSTLYSGLKNSAEYQQTRQSKSTHLTFETWQQNRITWSVQDFPGTPSFEPLLYTFLSAQKSIAIIVLNLETDSESINQQFHRWASTLNSLHRDSGRTEVLVVGTSSADDQKIDWNLGDNTQSYTRLVFNYPREIIKISLANHETAKPKLEQLRDRLYDYGRTKLMRVPKVLQTVRRLLKRRRKMHKFLDISEFLEILENIINVYSPDYVAALAQHLSDMRDTLTLNAQPSSDSSDNEKTLVILDPEWLSRVIRVVCEPSFSEAAGFKGLESLTGTISNERLVTALVSTPGLGWGSSAEELKHALAEEKDMTSDVESARNSTIQPQQVDDVISLLVRFHILVNVPQTNSFLAVSRLSAQKHPIDQAATVDLKYVVSLRYRCREPLLLPAGLFANLIARLCEDLRPSKISSYSQRHIILHLGEQPKTILIIIKDERSLDASLFSEEQSEIAYEHPSFKTIERVFRKTKQWKGWRHRKLVLCSNCVRSWAYEAKDPSCCSVSSVSSYMRQREAPSRICKFTNEQVNTTTGLPVDEQKHDRDYQVSEYSVSDRLIRPNPTRVDIWSIEDVCQWVASLGVEYEQYVDAFRDEGIKGAPLIRDLDEDTIGEIINNVEHQKYLLNKIEELRELREDQEGAKPDPYQIGSLDSSTSKKSDTGPKEFDWLGYVVSEEEEFDQKQHSDWVKEAESGIKIIKHGRSGKPAQRTLTLDVSNRRLIWKSKSFVMCRDISGIEIGKDSKVFERSTGLNVDPDLCLVIHANSDKGGRTLDLQFNSKEQRDRWCEHLQIFVG